MEYCFKHSEELASRLDVNSKDPPFYFRNNNFAKNIYWESDNYEAKNYDAKNYELKITGQETASQKPRLDQ
ncbi:uncharacterized protein Bfra_001815 [Botrytis fragariae]|uniref:Uncharacterized protein n=1 Tax=Botrytis fragariae TaxID=1964551 RepID=A0A8H6B0Z5_9HELO|nr:uncharacterized protein Bfra_001815 [Botrytis fragariae]KAF5877448.1 hypothetical protein Bfra_001815 [Botrytis fragariae]